MKLAALAQAIAFLAALAAPYIAHAGRPFVPEDWYRFHPLSDVQLSPDGGSVAYLVTTYDKASDESRAALWMTDWAGASSVQLTQGESVSAPRFSPDGGAISFLASRPSEAPAQLWVLDRRGGEARQLSHLKSEIVDYEWSPDSSHIVLVAHPPTDEDKDDTNAEKKPPKPIIINRLQFKRDDQGYVTADARTALFLLDAGTGVAAPLSNDPQRDASDPTFSPDSKHIAFVSHSFDDPASQGRDAIFIVEARAGSAPRPLLSTESPNGQKLEWSPDGRLIAFLRGDEPRYTAYIADRLAVADATTGKVRMLTERLDRAVYASTFTSDGKSIVFSVEDDGFQYPASVNVETGVITRLGEHMVVHDLAVARDRIAVLVSSDAAPTEVFALESGKLRSLTAHNRELFSEITLGSVEDIAFKSRDGTDVHGQLVKPPGFVKGRRYPTIVWIHGGPNGQDDHSLELWGYGPPMERQFFATHGYVALGINYRGGSGRGTKYARSIAGDWGHKEVEDLLAGVDYAVASGIADRERLGIGGWSYGGILTDYTIASDTRFKGAISGAGSANQIAMYGSDQYVDQYNAELGAPWRNPALWLKVSYPFFHADRIRTPTLFLGGEADFNVPIAGGEQMYQALRTLGVPTELVIYPGEHHVPTRPSFLVDRSKRYFDWMEKYLGKAEAKASAAR